MAQNSGPNSHVPAENVKPRWGAAISRADCAASARSTRPRAVTAPGAPPRLPRSDRRRALVVRSEPIAARCS